MTTHCNTLLCWLFNGVEILCHYSSVTQNPTATTYTNTIRTNTGNTTAPPFNPLIWAASVTSWIKLTHSFPAPLLSFPASLIHSITRSLTAPSLL